MQLPTTEWEYFEECDLCGYEEIFEIQEELKQVESYVHVAKALLRRGEQLELMEAKKNESPVPFERPGDILGIWNESMKRIWKLILVL